ncbi:MAG: phenylalanine--tRNA ligase subunit beta [Candidatus Kerfeldbacteria bacterium]|nr:phenylalanine--tRNA ligase subunit beta [Candidatus Kerfeldbacteria bacterium]
MNISRNWLSEFVDLSGLSSETIADKLTMTIAEVEKIVDQRKGLEHVVVGEVLECKKHPNADKLHVAHVKVGKRKTIQLIFGQMVTMQNGDRVPVAIAPTTLPSGIHIERKRLRGELSEGMLCLDTELGLAEYGVAIQYFPDVEPGTPIAEALGFDDVIFHIDNKSLTHRADLFSHIGIARELAAAFSRPMNDAAFRISLRSKKLRTVRLSIADPNACRRFIGTVLNVKVGPLPMFMRRRLEACGVRSINNIVDITNYVMLELGEPLHAYDYEKLQKRGAGKIHISARFAGKNERVTTLDRKTRTCTEDIQLIADAKGSLGIAGIMGGEDSEISDSTSKIFLEAAQFDPIVTRKAAQYFGLRTEGASRWEKGISPELAGFATFRAITLFKKYANGEVLEGPEDLYPTKPRSRTITVRPEYVSHLLGFSVSEREVVRSLERLGAQVRNLAKAKSVTPPWWREDLRIEEDFVEEVGRVVGLDRIPETSIVGELIGVEQDPWVEWGNVILDTCVRAGMTEVKNYAFYGDREVERAGLSKRSHRALLNSLSAELSVLRTNLLIGLIRNAVRNQRDADNISLCEFGHTFVGVSEPRIVSGLVLGDTSKTFFDAKGILEIIAARVQAPLRVTPLQKIPPSLLGDSSMLDSNASGTIWFRETVVGVLGLIREDVARAFKSEHQLAVFSLDVERVAAIAARYGAYLTRSQYPAVKRDISFVVGSDVSYEEICATISQAGAPELESLDLFDIYEGGKLSAGMRSLAFHLAYRAEDRTLTMEQADTVHQRIVNALQKNHRAEVR